MSDCTSGQTRIVGDDLQVCIDGVWVGSSDPIVRPAVFEDEHLDLITDE